MNYSLTNPQNSIWLTEKFYTGTSVNNICGYVYISDSVDFNALKKAINKLVKTNDSMRLKFKEENNSCVQYLNEYKEFDIDIVELSSEKDIEKKALEMANIPFEIKDNFLFKFILFKLPNNAGGFIVTVHHIISDSWTLGLIAKEVTGIYSEILSSTYEEKEFPSYLNYINYEKEYISSDKFNKDKEYWNEIFKTVPEVASIPSMKDSSSKNVSCKGSREKFIIPEKQINQIKEFCTKHKISVYNFFMAAYSLYLGRVSNLDDFVIGTPILNRTNFEQKHTMGMFISTAPLRINLDHKLSFTEFSKKVATDTMSILRHQRYPYQAILEDLRKKDSNIPNLYNVVLSYQITKTIEENSNIKYSTDWVFNGNSADELQIHLFDLHDESSITVAYDYKADKYDSQDITDMHNRILTIIDQVILNNDMLLKDIEIVTPEEKHKILYEFNNTKVDYPHDKTIVDLFEEQVEKTPDNIAVVFEDQKLTYRELNEKANQLAYFLMSKNVCLGDVVGIFLNKSLEVIISMFAILKTGASFLPIDIEYPEERINYILNNSKPKVILSSKGINKKINCNTIFIDLTDSPIYNNKVGNLNLKLSIEDVMYVMYTSGSTGTPKGVMVKHKNIIRLAMYPNFINFSEQEIMVQTGTIVFDACIFEIFGSLLHGFKLYIIKKENLLDIDYFSKFLEEKQVTILFLTTGLFNQFGLQKPDMFKSLKYLLTGGDVISKQSTHRIMNSCNNLKIINCYGPTENGSYSTCYEIRGNEKNIPIGKPITNSSAYIISNSGTLCPPDVPGELWVGGDGVAKGYLNNENLTKEKFIQNPFGNGLIYKTGDLVKWLPDGNIEFIGRIDNQVKVRGFRIELSEIDKQILDKNPNIKQSLTIIHNANNSKIISSYIVSNNNIDTQKLKNNLEKSLPPYMVPAFITQLNDLPLNINGKVDKKALPLPNINDKKDIILPRNELDSNIISCLNTVLNIDKISITDSFFTLGGDSLSAISFSSKLSNEFNCNISVQDIFNYPIIKDLSDYIDTLSEKRSINTIPKVEKQKHYPLSSAQKRIYYSSNLDSNSTLYNISGGIIIDKILDIKKLQKCFNALINRHEALRTYFDIVNNEVLQIVDDNIDFKLSLENTNTNDLNKIYTDFVKPFDLSKAPLFRTKLFELNDNKMLLLLDMHHIISDGTSLGILLQELCDLYNGSTLSEKQIDYKDFTLWEKEQFESDEFKLSKEYWVNQFKDEIPLLNMPSINPRPSVQNFEGSNYHRKLSKEVFDKVNEVAKKLNITPYMLMLSCYYILLSKYTSQDNIVVGTPIVGRELPELSNMLGMFVNTLAMRNKIDSSLSFEEFSKNIKENCLNSFKNQSYPFDMLVKDLKINRDTSRTPLFDVMFVYQNNGYPEISFKDSKTEYFVPDNNISKFDLTLEVLPINNEYDLRFEYCTKLFDEDFIKRFSSHYINILNAILDNNEIKIADIDMLSIEEKNQILYEFNNTKVDYPSNKTIVDLFEEQVEKTPDNIAVVFEDKKLTYRELNEKANQLANYLKSLDVKNGDVISILFDRSLEILVSILAVLKTGAAYLPLDPNYPNERLEYIFNDCKSKYILTNDISKKESYNNAVIYNCTDSLFANYDKSNLKINISASSPSYLIYTSGSTGTPKGVVLKHLSLTNLAYYCNNYIEYLKEPEYISIVSVTTVSFDIFIFETLISLQRGLKVVLANSKEQNLPVELNKLIEKENIQAIQTTPSRMQTFYNNIDSLSNLKNLKYITLAGEQLPVDLAQNLHSISGAKIYNGYGPSETTVFATLTDVTNKDKQMTIGKPLSNTQIYILDSNKNLCPVGVHGEIYISGDDVGLGYVNNPNLTNQSFLENPFIQDSIMYKSGDLGYYTQNGEIICLGRVDHQVKIRGLRIELEEIENVIKNDSNIDTCIVSKVVNSSGNDCLCAYFTQIGPVDISTLKSILYKKLPNYMVPEFYIKLDNLPYTPNGKIDKKKLPVPTVNTKNDFVKARNDIDKFIITSLRSLLKVENISITDSIYSLGGDSLTAISLSTSIYTKFKVSISIQDILNYPVIKDLSDYVSTLSEKRNINTIEKAEKAKYYPLSSAQKRIYYSSSLNNNSTLYNIAGGIIVDKILDVNKLQECFNILINRHDALRTHFDIVDNEVVQIIDDNIDFKLSLDNENTDNLNKIYTNFVKPFDLSRAPLFRTKLVKLEDNKMLLLLDMHHIISDGTSLTLLLQDLCDLYNDNNLIENQIDYKDFTLWEKEQFESEEFKSSKEYWVNQFKDEIPLLNMPTINSRPSVQNFEGSNYHTRLSKEVFDKVNNVAKYLNITPYMLMLSCYYILLSKYTSQDDIVVGTPVVGRELPELSHMLGMFVNTLALRNKIDNSLSFEEFSKVIKENCLNCFKNQNYPFDMLVKELNIKRDTSRNPLFDVMFIYQNNGYPKINFKNSNAKYFIPDNNVAKFDLSLEVIPVDDEYDLRFEYCTKLFNEDFIKRFSSHYINILNTILENIEIKIANIDMLSKEEKNQILYEFNNTKVDYPHDKTIVDLFEEQVEKTPDKIAVVFEDQKLTYRELNYKANQLARFLLANNVTIGDIVGILLDKSLESLISILGILKSGAAFLPIDVGYPNERIDYIINNSKANIILTNQSFVHKVNDNVQPLSVDSESNYFSLYDNSNLNIKYDVNNMAYIMYTSGSTGNPKGVMVTHKNIVRLVKNNKFITFDKEENILQTGSIVFDACTFEIWGALLNGFKLFIIKKEDLLDANILEKYLENNKITTLWLTAPLFNQLCETNPYMFKNVKKLLTGGDVLSPKHINMVRKSNPDLTVINGYGPTENTTFSCCFTIDKKYTSSIPIGKPISNSTAYVVSNSGLLCPVGVPGELWVGGDGVSKGYLNNESLTKEKFIQNPFSKGIVYKTGDLVKWLPDGNIEFIGRIDNQVKIRGFRVELGEINSKILAYPSINECITLIKEIKGEKAICLYYVSDKEIDIQDLKQYLKKSLPNYMVPSHFKQMSKLPINVNGKIDKNLLPNTFDTKKEKNKIKEPINETQKVLLDIFKKLLSVEDIGIDDDFFELGGDSLSAIKLQIEAISNNINLKYSDIFDYPTVEELAEHTNQTEDIFIEANYDYKKYDSILKTNKTSENMKISNTPVGNVLLTGFTGFLGAHVLDSFIKKEKGDIYCLIRGKNNMTPKERLENVLHFYFDTKYDKYIGNRIRLVEGDITENDFGLNMIDYNILGTNINTVIHCAALVKHYGTYKEFENINIFGTKRIVDFCKTFRLKLLHVSTISVSGNNLAEGANIDNHFEHDMIFDETNFYIGQNLKNFYVRSKFEAERIVLDAILEGLEACILRMGNLTSRFSEGKFQQNHFENAFVNTIKSFIQIGCVPEYLLDTYCEFTPIDFCGDAIIDIANHITKDYSVFHLLNEKHVYIDRLFSMLNEIGIDVNLVAEKEFRDIIMTLLEDENKRNNLEGIINKLDNNKKFIYKSDVTIESNFTKEFLSKIGFEWPYIDTNYIRNYFKYLSNIGYFNLNIN